MKITEEFRRSMNWLHTWLGIGVSTILFAIFWTGTLSVFDQEIDQWMVPEKRLVLPETVNLDNAVLPWIQQAEIEQGARVNISPPDARSPAIRIDVRAQERQIVFIDPETGAVLKPIDSLGGTGFFFPFHYRLHIDWMVMGAWIVGLVTMAMLALIVSGIFIHRKIIQDFFVFRRRKSLRRSSLDAHNLSGVLFLPFHFMIAFSGILILAQVYFGWAGDTVYGGDRAAEMQDQGFYFRPAAGEPGSIPNSIQDWILRAETTWNAESRNRLPINADGITINHYGDAGSYVSVISTFPSSRVGLVPAATDFDLSTGEILNNRHNKPVFSTFTWLAGLHFIQFDHWPLRWLYFFGGLAGCVMIASGLMFWMKARVRKGVIEPRYIRAVRALTIGSVTGIILASGAFLVANRLLPRDAAFASYDRSDLEVWAFFIVWIASFCHATIRDTKAWRDQAVVIAFTAALAVLLNWVTTGDHLIQTITEGLWSIAGMDLILIASSIIAIASVSRLLKTERLAVPSAGLAQSAKSSSAE